MNKRPKIALVAGGYSGEYEVSLKSRAGIMSFLEGHPLEIYPVLIQRNAWVVELDGQRYPIDRNDFSFERNGERITFNYAYITIHGTPGEDGLLTGYLDMLGIPYSCCPTAIGALTFNKYLCKHFLHSFGIAIAPSVRLRRGDGIRPMILAVEPGLPAFVKPNVGGSSVATTRVDAVEGLLPAVEAAFAEGEEVLVEALITGTEVTCGAYEDAEGLHVLPVTEVVPKRAFFDYDAKYNGAVEEITPARIGDMMTTEIQQLTREIYGYLGASGIIRVDYIIEDGRPILLEVNTTPGMTATSFIPQQVAADGKDIGTVLEGIINYHLSRKRR
ncbi:D-alanine--D-alanine ligase [Porphyromonas levii]|uniref:D-alanine--D-alanine ligase n=1 Tax=Porphyromonas levii TaxID=28114 RepID=UPI001B8C8ECD|nr:D-alanine--D-alanine ligase [Porphyromonas levii]MBR8703486.1 D-alanine--D-alanine ligase B [Porphyromonas levii]MBR8713697.1 D-alanine--D-alanine ligase B [Porphyromonas levii]MBR8715694.1 D-alanine--D-alanine ligase B [Porphyromonas levii]MBR8728258.1 D-alanine--D-alanine ligase B [Porphyromonas levii]MBR8730039.1 D-alanine--D-alanine ligase B [Porphyromonas levii]